MAVCKNLEVFRKSTKAYIIRFTKDGTLEDITDWTIYFTVKEKVRDADVDAKIKKDVSSHPSGENGIAEIELNASDTDLIPGNYYYSIDFKDDNGNEDVLYYGRFKVKNPTRKNRT
jgi:hypothetical protein